MIPISRTNWTGKKLPQPACQGQENTSPKPSKMLPKDLPTWNTPEETKDIAQLCLSNDFLWSQNTGLEIQFIRRDIATKLLTSEDPLKEKDLKKWNALLTETLKPLIEVVKKHPENISSQELLCLITRPISKKDLSLRPLPQPKTIEKYTKRILSLCKESITLPLLASKYRLEKVSIGNGTFKTFYKVVTSSLSSCLALGASSYKTEQNSLYLLERSKQEVNLLLKLRGEEGWIQLHEVTYRPILKDGVIVGIQQGLLMDHYLGDGKDLLKLLKEKPEFNTAQNKLEMFKTLVKALQLLHIKHELVHQDVKKTNILYTIDAKTQKLSVVMADPGLAAPMGKTIGRTKTTAPYEYLLKLRLEERNPKINTKLLYEQVVDESTDVYGLGLIAYEWYLGSNDRHPALNKEAEKTSLSTDQILEALEEDWFEEPSKGGILHLIWRMCNNDLLIRPVSMEEVLNKLEKISIPKALKKLDFK